MVPIADSRSALEWVEPGSIADKMIRDANAYLISLRQAGDPDAAGLVVCVDCEHADRVAAHMAEHILTWRPVVACSRSYDDNDPAPADAIEQFSHGYDPWIVAVNMVSEGVDIRRLRVVVYLTNRTTLLSFRQIVGRVVRSDPSNRPDTGRVYIAADPRILEMAREITREVTILPPPMSIITDSTVPANVKIKRDQDFQNRVAFKVLSTTPEQGAVFDTSDNSAHALLIEKARRFILVNELTGTDPESLALLAKQNPALQSKIMLVDEEE